MDATTAFFASIGILIAIFFGFLAVIGIIFTLLEKQKERPWKELEARRQAALEQYRQRNPHGYVRHLGRDSTGTSLPRQRK